jgi:hypothetical protein
MDNLLYVLEIDIGYHEMASFGKAMISFTYLSYLTSMQVRTPLS